MKTAIPYFLTKFHPNSFLFTKQPSIYWYWEINIKLKCKTREKGQGRINQAALSPQPRCGHCLGTYLQWF